MCSTRDFLEVLALFFLLFTFFLPFLEIPAGSGLFVDTETMEGHGPAAGNAFL